MAVIINFQNNPMIDSAQKKDLPDAQYTAYPTLLPDITPSNPFWKSPRFWFIGAGAVSSILIRPDFADLPWNQIVGQIIAVWATGAWGTGQWDRTVDKLSK